MARTNLAYINESVQAALEQEMEQPRLTAEAAARAAQTHDIKLVAGIVVADDSKQAAEKVRATAREARREKIRTFQSDREAILKKLDEHGIVPRAVAPTGMWERLCDTQGLYRVSPDSNGRVGVQDGKALISRLEKWSLTYSLALWLGVGIASWTYCWKMNLLRIDSGWGMLTWIALVCAGAIVWGLDAMTEGDAIIGWTYRKLVGVLLYSYRFMPHRTILRQYFPARVSADTRYSSNPSVTIILPTPPAEVAERLLKVRGLSLGVAVAPEAVSFLETPAEVYKEDFKASHDAYEARVRARKELLRDPIITYRHGTAVAIIDQYGDFTMEKKTVDQCVNSEFLI